MTRNSSRPEDAVSCSFAGFNGDQKERHDDTELIARPAKTNDRQEEQTVM